MLNNNLVAMQAIVELIRGLLPRRAILAAVNFFNCFITLTFQETSEICPTAYSQNMHNVAQIRLLMWTLFETSTLKQVIGRISSIDSDVE